MKKASKKGAPKKKRAAVERAPTVRMKVAVMIDEYGKTQAAVTTDGGDPSAKLSSRFLGSGPVAIHVFESSVSLPRPKTKRVRTKKITGDQYNDVNGGAEIKETLWRLGFYW